MIETSSDLISQGIIIKDVFGQKLSNYDVKQFVNKVKLCLIYAVTNRINEYVLKLLKKKKIQILQLG